MYAEANDVYNEISEDSVAYYSAQVKKPTTMSLCKTIKTLKFC